MFTFCQQPGRVSLALFTMLVVGMIASVHADEDHHNAATDSGELRWSAGRPDGHAPIGVMADHTHGAGEWMASYRYMFMDMDGNRGRGGRKDTSDVLADFMVSPLRMYMEMHMVGLMHAPTDNLTMMAMVPYIRQSMDHKMRTGVKFKTRTEGIGDIKASALYVLHRWSGQQIHLNAGVSLPTGSIDEKDDLPSGEAKLPYPMQLGSGTFDLLPGLTYLGQSGDLSWGAQGIGTVRLGRNSADYALGDRGMLTIWSALRWTNWLSSSLRVTGEIWDNIDGRDDDLNPMMVPTADPRRRGGERVDVALGFNLYGREGALKGQRVAVEAGVPVYQALDGPQLEVDWWVMAGWQSAW